MKTKYNAAFCEYSSVRAEEDWIQKRTGDCKVDVKNG